MIVRAFFAGAADRAGVVAVAPGHERLRLHVSRRVGDGKAHARVNVIVGAPGQLVPAGVLDEVTGAVIGEIGLRRRPAQVEFRLR